MLNLLRCKKGQNTAEYAILIALAIGAAIAMQTYIKRGLQGGIKFAVDKSTKSAGTAQYEPYYLKSEYNTTTRAYEDTEETKADGAVTREIGVGAAKKTTDRSGYQGIVSTTGSD